MGRKYVYRCECGRVWTSGSSDGGSLWGQECKKCGHIVMCVQGKIAKKKIDDKIRYSNMQKNIGWIISIIIGIMFMNSGSDIAGVIGVFIIILGYNLTH